MTFLCWNCRGLRAAPTKGRLRKLITSHRPLLMFLSETLCPAAHASLLVSNLGFSSSFVVEPEGRKGGLLLSCYKPLSVHVLDACPFWIHAAISDPSVGTFAITFVNGHPVVHLRHVLWEFIKSTAANVKLPWLLAGDFNQVCWPEISSVTLSLSPGCRYLH